MRNTHSISAGLDYSGVSPIHSWLRDEGRTEYVAATDEQALEGWKMLVKHEGIIPALESAHAVAEGLSRAREMNSDQILVINVSGRGDKDLFITTKAFGDEGFTDFLRRTIQNTEGLFG